LLGIWLNGLFRQTNNRIDQGSHAAMIRYAYRDIVRHLIVAHECSIPGEPVELLGLASVCRGCDFTNRGPQGRAAAGARGRSCRVQQPSRRQIERITGWLPVLLSKGSDGCSSGLAEVFGISLVRSDDATERLKLIVQFADLVTRIAWVQYNSYSGHGTKPP